MAASLVVLAASAVLATVLWQALKIRKRRFYTALWHSLYCTDKGLAPVFSERDWTFDFEKTVDAYGLSGNTWTEVEFKMLKLNGGVHFKRMDHVEKPGEELVGTRVYIVPEPPKAVRKAKSCFSLASAVLPARIANEEFGDALEDVRTRLENGCGKLEICLKIGATIFWVTFHALTYELTRLGKAIRQFR